MSSPQALDCWDEPAREESELIPTGVGADVDASKAERFRFGAVQAFDRGDSGCRASATKSIDGTPVEILGLPIGIGERTGDGPQPVLDGVDRISYLGFERIVVKHRQNLVMHRVTAKRDQTGPLHLRRLLPAHHLEGPGIGLSFAAELPVQGCENCLPFAGGHTFCPFRNGSC